MKVLPYKDLSQEQKDLIKAATEVMANSYSPYSKFKVGAAGRTPGGKIITGTNYENVAHDSICAEQAVLSCANSQGEENIEAMAIVGEKEAVSPCGQCRQYLTEQANKQWEAIEIIIAGPQKDLVAIEQSDKLLPGAFDKER